jgi:hypothetical protein
VNGIRFDRLVLVGLLAGACDFDDPGTEVATREVPLRAPEAKVTTVAQSAPPSPLPLLPAASISTPPEQSPCPSDMLEVSGSYCTDVLHRCVKGGRTHTGEDTEEPEPFYCDVYQKGYAKCLGREEPRHFCIDEFEYPNRQGAIPMVMVSWYEARRLCENDRKRLCGDDEWTLACEGPERWPYPYGWARDRTACNIDRLWVAPNDGLLASKTATLAEVEAEVERLSKRVPSGSMERCKSPYGVVDMGGNVDEWAVNVTLGGKPYQSVFKGGHWVSGARNRCRPITASHDETTVYYAEGFRCCATVRAPAVQ